ncbi:MAG: SRPBCC domain-containing protein [Pseudonocardiales bacterium]|nr:SRPBCC domain-containing protein [Pseudonocardiales bacterium]
MTSTTSTKTEDFTAVLNLTAGPATVAALFTSAAGVSRWWGPTEGDAAVGGTLVTSFGDHGVNTMRVLEAGPTRVVWESIASDLNDDGSAIRSTPTGHAQEWLGTTMEFDIVPAGTGTELRFRHAGLTPQLACWDDCFAAWTYFMASIQSVAETGTGTPFAA